MRSALFLIFLGLSVFIPVYLDTLHVREDYIACMKREVCEDEDGIPKVLICLRKLAKNDTNLICDVSNSHFAELSKGNKDLALISDAACKHPEAAAKMFDDYHKRREENKGQFAPDDKKKLAECRTCLSTMIGKCLVERKISLL